MPQQLQHQAAKDKYHHQHSSTEDCMLELEQEQGVRADADGWSRRYLTLARRPSPFVLSSLLRRLRRLTHRDEGIRTLSQCEV